MTARWATAGVGHGHAAAQGGTAVLGRQRRAVCAAVVLAMVGALVGLGSQHAMAASQQIASDGPLTRIEISDDLNCAVWHAQDAEPEFYGETACATLAAVDGVLYGPEVIPGGQAAEETPYTPVNQQPVQGSGTDADPYRIVTVVALGSSGLQITQTDSYVVGQESYRTDVEIANATGAAKSLTLWRAGDCNLQDSDFGFGSADPASGAVACVAPDPANPEAPGERVEQWLPISAGSAYYEHDRLDVWARIGAQRPFDNTCSCAQKVDNGAGLSWQLTVPAGASTVRSHLTTFSPLGWVPLTTAKMGDDDHTAPGGVNGYTITVTNTNPVAVQLDAIVDTLPEGFGYTAGSTTGVTTADPAVAGGQLTWSGPFPVPASGQVTLHFDVVVASTPGTYLNNAGGSAQQPFTVSPTGHAAPVTVSTDPDPTPDPDDPPPDSGSDPDPDPTPGEPQVVRLWGDSRVTTAIALSQHTRPGGAAAVVLARADAYPDALAGAPLAAQLDAPVLLTGGGALDPAVAAEIDRLGATSAFLLGGTGALSQQVEADLQARGVGDISRLAGASRFETAARIGERVVGSRVGQVPVYVVEGANADPGRGWPDAVSVSGLAALQERPILLVVRDRLPDETRAALGALGVGAATVVGGSAAVSDQVAAAVADHDGDGDADAAVTRLAGATRYETSRAVADQSVADGADPALTWFATGRNYPDALAAGPAVGDSGGLLLLLDGQGLDGSPAARAWLTDHRSAFTLIRLVGGTAAISAAVEDEIRATVGAG